MNALLIFMFVCVMCWPPSFLQETKPRWLFNVHERSMPSTLLGSVMKRDPVPFVLRPIRKHIGTLSACSSTLSSLEYDDNSKRGRKHRSQSTIQYSLSNERRLNLLLLVPIQHMEKSLVQCASVTPVYYAEAEFYNEGPSPLKFSECGFDPEPHVLKYCMEKPQPKYMNS
ncbi:unnamed protein product [Prorocentrum cordatum]|uniref:Transmembrane 9 superfamily member n=1 Tax=Prorocentrum cordatum TaxID=2364126 RepID=A0ABN9PAZ9_9DINO|nr:unnamed protein product [Polarella glacialis]